MVTESNTRSTIGDRLSGLLLEFQGQWIYQVNYPPLLILVLVHPAPFISFLVVAVPRFFSHKTFFYAHNEFNYCHSSALSMPQRYVLYGLSVSARYIRMFRMLIRAQPQNLTQNGKTNKNKKSNASASLEIKMLVQK